MTYDEQTGDTIFSTGRRVDAHAGIIGINADGEIFDGYDGGFDVPPHNPLTADEKRELADEMIARWQRYRDAA